MIDPVYDRDGIQIFHANCLEVLPQLADRSAALVLTDPPYEFEAHTRGRRAFAGGIEDRPLGFGAITEQERVASAAEMARIGNGWLMAFCQVEGVQRWREAFEAGGSRYIRTQIWVKPNGAPAFTGDRPGVGYESILTCWKDTSAPGWNGGGRHGVYTHNTVHGGTIHMTEKPIALMRELVALFSNPGDIVLDPYMGSGTTLRAARDLGRRAIGIEMSNEIGEDGVDRRYVDVAIERLRQGVLL